MTIIGTLKNAKVSYDDQYGFILCELVKELDSSKTYHGIAQLLIGSYDLEIGSYISVSGNNDFNVIKLNKGLSYVINGHVAFIGSITTYKN